MNMCPKQQQQTQAQTGVRFLFCETFRSSPVVDMSVHGDHEHSLEAPSAPSSDPVSHNALRRQRTARAGVWGRELNYAATIRDPPTPQPELFSLEEEPGGARPLWLPVVPGPQERAQRRTVLQTVDPVLSLPTLDDPAPQIVEQLPDILLFFDALSLVPEQVIEVPKILPWTSWRTMVREPQLAEQLVEVPTIVSFLELTFQLVVVVELVEVFLGFSQVRTIL